MPERSKSASNTRTTKMSKDSKVTSEDVVMETRSTEEPSQEDMLQFIAQERLQRDQAWEQSAI